jgi:predicted regulator of Ras-like GTPase activity (Roadblock/LC7/MglB family)
VTLEARRRGSPPPERDTPPTPFEPTLARLVVSVPGAQAAALVDHEGEVVDYAGKVEPFDVKLAAAHLQIVLAQASRTRTFSGIELLVVRAEQKSFLIAALPQAYAVVLVLARGAGQRSCARALAVAAHAISQEAGWAAPPPRCRAVDVTTDARGRPIALRDGASSEDAEVLGTLAGPRRTRTYRVRLGSGAELTVVREAPGAWFVDSDGVSPP